MKVMISYFNNIRHFEPNMIPLSTAKWDPKWYRDEHNCVYRDKRGVLNGFRCEMLVFDDRNWTQLMKDNLECCRDCPQYKDRREDFCMFMKLYLEQLRQIDFKDFIRRVKEFIIRDDLIPVLIVHEKPDRLCAERYVLKQWFKENGYELEEVLCNE